MTSRTALVPVEDPSRCGEARRLCGLLCRETGLDEALSARAALVTTELATNLAKHARGGRILLRPLAQGERRGLEILSVDSGPGMPDVARCLRDGYSTTGSPGTGLGAVLRISAEFDLHSAPGGTVLLSRLWAEPRTDSRPASAPAFALGAVSIPLHEGDPCGDDWEVVERPGRLVCAVADGLGHGPEAARAARAATAVLRKSADAPTDVLATEMHAALRGTRGAALAVAEIDLAHRVLRFTGIGNVSACLHGGAPPPRHLVSHNGTAGAEVRKIQEFTLPWPPDGLLVLHTDGLSARWSLEDVPGLSSRHPAVIAGRLFRDRSRGTDDSTVLVIRAGGAD